MKYSLIKEKLKNIDQAYNHPSYIHEKKLVNDIKLGHLRDALLDLEQLNEHEKTELAEEPLRSLKNSMIVSCSLFARAAINGGVDSEDAFDLNDVFINHIEKLTTLNALKAFEFEMLQDFVLLVQKTRTAHYAYPVSKITKYIYENAADKISVHGLAEHFELSPDYLSKLFHKEVGMHLTDYIHEQKINLAKSYLEFSQMRISDIAILLEFSNPAHFSNTFHKMTGITPGTYRKERNTYI